MKIGLVAAVVLAGLTAVFYVVVTDSLEQSARQDVESRVARAQRIYRDISQLNGLKLANLAAERARASSVLEVFDKTEPAARQQAAYEVCEAQNQQLRQEGRKADIVAILDAGGKIVGRDLNPNADAGMDLRARYPAVAKALEGVAVKDVWTWQDRVHEVAVAPVLKADHSVAGAMVFAWVVSAVTAQANRDLLDTEIGFFHAGKVYASSFVSSVDRSKEDVAKSQALSQLLFAGQQLASTALTSRTPTPVTRWTTTEGRVFAVVVAPSPGNFADKTSGFVVLASLSESMVAVRAAGMKVIGLGFLAIVVALVASVLTARRFISPLDKIELGVAEVINGNIDYTFKPVGQDFEGLSNSLNVMLARLLGREEPNEEAVEEDEGGSQAWKAESMVIEETDGRAPAETVKALAGEPEAAYYPRLYGEYVAALQKLGQPTEGMSVLAFMAKLSLTEAGLREKWECKVVRFLLAASGNKIAFRPVKIA
ncbi:MAG: hypothetical protein JXP73_10415 [Deltaproteobacteria bacterium]|nr:hypothetical protein [Deltaproteobacteria bacterium]